MSRAHVAVYDQLLAVAPTAGVALNLAVATGEVEGPAAALALVDELERRASVRWRLRPGRP